MTADTRRKRGEGGINVVFLFVVAAAIFFGVLAILLAVVVAGALSSRKNPIGEHRRRRGSLVFSRQLTHYILDSRWSALAILCDFKRYASAYSSAVYEIVK
ncbi:MAG: hypothetical protein E6471_00315 [Bradyrhizobium sp.]|nr:hypothetical protein [Bradyrhizobium sp.]